MIYQKRGTYYFGADSCVPLLKNERVISRYSLNSVNIGVDEFLSLESLLVVVGKVLENCYCIGDFCPASQVASLTSVPAITASPSQ